MTKPPIPAEYASFLGGLKERIRTAQHRAAQAVNAELVRLYWDIGRAIHERQEREGWGAAVIPRLAADLKNELPELKGFSVRNLKRMVQFANEYPQLFSIGPPPVAQLQIPEIKAVTISPTAVAKTRRSRVSKGPPPVAHTPDPDLLPILQRIVAHLPWAHNVLLMQMVKDLPTRLWYGQQAIEHGWSRDGLADRIRLKLHERQGRAVTNFPARLEAGHSELAHSLLKDPYIFDFLTLEEPFHERELETGLVAHLERFLVELGQGFAFVGRQYHLSMADDDFYIDLLFYHLRLRCYIVIDLKRGKFKPEYAGKVNFYCSVVDDKLRHADDRPTIGLILCQEKDRVLAEYSLRDINKPIGVSDYELTRALPKELASSLPSIEQIEAELEKVPRATAKPKPRARKKRNHPS
jgi:predicted nuclease of restriction endonuclease-like (RecB) superfamily